MTSNGCVLNLTQCLVSQERSLKPHAAAGWYEMPCIQTGSSAFAQVALQFPDKLLADAITVAKELRLLTGRRVFILGDTTYGRCGRPLALVMVHGEL